MTSQPPGAWVAGQERVPAALVAGAAVLVGLVLVRTAWMSDDAFITLRTIDNFVNGYGLRWNVAERVQTFTHPAWLLVLTPVYALTREPYFTTLAVQMLLAVATAVLLTRVVALTWQQAVLAVAVLVNSKALVDFSTSGLENPLTHLALLGVFVACRATWSGRPRPGATYGWSAVVLLCRLDLVLLLAPVLVLAFRAVRPRPILPLLLGAVPLLAWEAFSLVYYGALVPNTALAKLATGIPLADLLQQGARYWLATAAFDPLTVVAIAAGALLLATAGDRPGRAMVLGAALYSAYLLRVGGDFMSGRFLTPVLFWLLLGVAGLVRPTRRWWSPRVSLAAAGAVLVAGLSAPPVPPLLSGAGFGSQTGEEQAFIYGVTDERRFYYPTLGLLRHLGAGAPPEVNAWAETGRTVRARTDELQVIAANNVGLFGYHAGPAVHIIDRNALCDPFLARLPASSPWRIGHFMREVPDEYLESWRTRTNLLADPGLRELFDEVRALTGGPIWSRRRMSAALQLNLGWRRP